MCIIITHYNGIYDRVILKFDDKLEIYSTRIEPDIAFPYINFTVLDKGIVVLMNETGEIQLFSAKHDVDKIKYIDGATLSNTKILFNNGLQVMFYEKNEIFKISMK